MSCAPRTPRRRRQPAPGLFLIALLLAAAAAAQPQLQPLPDLRLEHAESGLRERLEEARSAIDWMLSRQQAEPPELAQAFGELGRLCLASGLDDAAAVAFGNASLLAPEEFRWAYYLGALEQQERRLGASESALRRALELEPDAVPALLRLGDVLLLAGRPAAAGELFDRVLALSAPAASRAYAHWGLGKIAVDAERWQQAAEHFEAALAAAPQATSLHRLLGLAYRELGERERARAELAASGADAVSFADPLMESLAEVDTGAYAWRALQARRRGDLEQAAELYRRAIEAAPEVASYRRSLSNVLALSGDVDAAIAELERAIELEPDHAAAQLQLGRLLSQREGASEKSLGCFEKAVELAPQSREAKLELGRALAVAQRHQEALAYYDAVVASDPRDPEARLLRARSRARLGRDAAAAEDYQAVLAVEPENRRAMIDLATVLSRQQETSRALELFERALELDLVPRDRALALFSAAALHQQLGDVAAAIPLYRQALELAPEMKDAHFNLAAALARSGDPAAAVEHFRRATEIEPGDAAARLAWAQALVATGDYAGARKALEDGTRSEDAEPRLVDALAQLLATCPDAAQRDPARAVELATRALTADPTVQHAATLARALAAAGRLEEAVALQQKVVADAERLGVPADQVERLRQALAYYERLRQTPAAGDGPP